MQMKHKSAEQKRTRRNRYIAAIEPFRQQFGCTAGKVHGVINDIVSENRNLKAKIERMEDEAEKVKVSNLQRVVQLKAKIADLENQLLAPESGGNPF